MSYQLKPDESLQQALNRIGFEEMKTAISRLEKHGLRPKTVHDVRKALKRTRSFLRLLRPLLGQEAFKRQNSRLRRAANNLSGARDTQVMLMTLKGLGQTAPERHEFKKRNQPMRNWLKKKHRKKLRRLQRQGLEDTLKCLTRARRDLINLQLQNCHKDDLFTSLQTSFRTGQNNLAIALERRDGASCHDLRKSVQLHTRQLQLLAGGWPEMIGVEIAEAKRLGELLGDDHDLCILCETAQKHKALYSDPNDLHALTQMIVERQEELRHDGFCRAKRLFLSQTPKGFARRMICWRETPC